MTQPYEPTLLKAIMCISCGHSLNDWPPYSMQEQMSHTLQQWDGSGVSLLLSPSCLDCVPQRSQILNRPYFEEKAPIMSYSFHRACIQQGPCLLQYFQ